MAAARPPLTSGMALSRQLGERMTIVVHKADPALRVGVSFTPDDDLLPDAIGATVSGLHPYGIATKAGLRAGDIVLTINGRPPCSSLDAAQMLRTGTGDVWLAIARPDSGREELYDLTADPGENNSLAETHPAILQRGRDLLAAHRTKVSRLGSTSTNSTESPDEMSPEVEAQLRALGYID